jgi:hypothetical protein
VQLVTRLRERLPEMERAILAHLRETSLPKLEQEPTQLAEIRSAIDIGLESELESVMHPDWRGSLPAELSRVTRTAAREGLGLDTVLRRCVVAHGVFEEFVLAEAGEVPIEVLRRVMSDQRPQVDRVMALVAAAYTEEAARLDRPPADSAAERIARSLAGDDFAAPAGVEYDFDLWHVGLILWGPEADLAARLLPERLGSHSLRVPREQGSVWLWLGSERRAVLADLDRFLVHNTPAGASAAVGEPREGLGGWRLTHREAQVAMEVVPWRGQKVTRAKDVTLVAGVMRDETLVRALLETYVAPLGKSSDSRRTLLDTVRAYLSAGENAAATAAGIGVARHTVQRRIRFVEEALGRPLHSCHAELRVALEVQRLTCTRTG